jgi:hypothetical protein
MRSAATRAKIPKRTKDALRELHVVKRSGLGPMGKDPFTNHFSWASATEGSVIKRASRAKRFFI